MKKKRSMRLWVQLAWTALTNGYAAGFAKGRIYMGSTKRICLPGLNCYSCPGALGACPIGALQAVLGSNAYGFSYYVFGFLIAVGALSGRLTCGFLCPFGLVQDLLHKIPIPKLRRIPGEKWLIWLKYLVFALFVVVLPLSVVNVVGQGMPWFCKWICPSGTLLGGIPLLAANESLRMSAGWLFAWKVFLLAFLLILSVVSYRPFCRFLCPLGAVYSLANPIAIYRYELIEEKCIRCGRCRQVCKLGIDPSKTPNHPECIRCGECIRECPTQALLPTLRRKAKKEENGCADCKTCPHACAKKEEK